jgi:hypothetical protein
MSWWDPRCKELGHTWSAERPSRCTRCGFNPTKKPEPTTPAPAPRAPQECPGTQCESRIHQRPMTLHCPGCTQGRGRLTEEQQLAIIRSLTTETD